MSYERSDDRERYSESEDREATKDHEREESPESKTSETYKNPERGEDAERAADRASRELEEYESESNEAREIADESSRELDSLERENEQSLEDELGHDLQETRDNLHDRFVNDMEKQLDGPSHKESETNEQGEDGASSETTESSESYHDAGDGMAYALETKGGSGEAEAAETEAEGETQEVSEPSSQEPAERQVELEAVEEPVNDKGTNRITRQDSEKGETTASFESQETHDHKTSHTSPKVSETNEDSQEVSEGQSDSEPAVSKEPGDDTGELSESEDYGEVSEFDVEAEDFDDFELEIDEIFESIEESEAHEENEAEVETKEHSEPEQEMSEGAEGDLEDTTSGRESPEQEVSDDPEVETEEAAEDDPLPETLDEFVERVREIMDKLTEEDDRYDYVQDPLTGEIQRVPKILAEYESDDQRQRRKRRNLFAELSEEERERFKELACEDERSAEAVEHAWNRVVEQAEREREELLERVKEILEEPDVQQLLENMSEEGEGSHASIEHAEDDDEVDEEEALEQFLPLTYDEFQEALQRHSKLLKRKNLEREIEQTQTYYECKKELEETDFSHMSKRQLWKHLSQKYMVPATTLKNWFAAGKLPRLLRAVRDTQARAAGYSPKKQRTPTELAVPKTYDEFMSMLARHPYLRDVKGFNQLLRDVQEYYRLREIAQRSSGSSYLELSRQVDVPVDTARSWIAGRSKPELLKRVLKNERLRREMESDLQAALSLMVDPSTVYDTLRFLRAKKNQTLKQIADALTNLVSKENTITIVRLKPYNARHGPRWLLDIAKKIQRNREKIQRMLDEHSTDAEIRLGFTSNNLYLWKHNPSLWNYVELFSQELFYFKQRFKRRLIQQARNRLGQKGNYHLSELIRQITDFQQEGSRKERIISDFRPEVEFLHGNVLQFLLESVKSSIKRIESEIEKIGLGDQLVSPKILTEEEMKILLSRLFAIITSDGSVDSDLRISYYEDNETRRSRVRTILSALGKVATPDIKKRDGTIGGFHIPSLLGRVLVKFGHPIGDKVLQGVRLPDFIMNGSPEVQLAYLQELIPEEGWVTIDDKDNIRISWARSVILSDTKKGSKFRFNQQLTPDLVQFIQDNGERKVKRSKWSEKDEIYYHLTMGKLDDLMEDSNQDIASKAKTLDRIVRANPSLHIEDEKHLCDANGIMTGEQSPGPIRYSKASKRVSVNWQVRVSTEDDVALWGLIAPPNDYRKRKKLTEWMNRHRKKVEKARSKQENSQDEIERLSTQTKEKGMSGR